MHSSKKQYFEYFIKNYQNNLKKYVFARKYLAYLAVDNEFPDAPWKLSIRMAVKKILL